MQQQNSLGKWILFALPLFVSILAVSQRASAEDWPRWMGPHGDGVYRETGVISEIPAQGLPVKWRVPIAGGYAGPAVAEGRVFVFDYVAQAGEVANNPGARNQRQGQERVTALDSETGEILWRHAYDRPYSISYAVGPRCTPTVDGSLVFTLGAEGDLHCLKTDSGEVVWQRSLPDDFGAEIPIWGIAGHPLVDGDLLYVMVGGKGQGVVALDKRTGQVRWKALDSKVGYAPPVIIEVGETRQLIIYHPAGVASLAPKTGKLFWEIPIAPNFEMAIAQPMLEGNRLYASGIQTEAVMIELDSTKPAAQALWRGRPKMGVYSGTSSPLLVDGILYGTDCNEGCLIAVDGASGERLWKTFEATRPDERRRISHGTAFITRLGDSQRYLLFSEMGDLLVAELTREGFKSLGRFHVLEPTQEAFGRDVIWSHPAYANRTGYFRNDKEVVAVDLRP